MLVYTCQDGWHQNVCCTTVSVCLCLSFRPANVFLYSSYILSFVVLTFIRMFHSNHMLKTLLLSRFLFQEKILIFTTLFLYLCLIMVICSLPKHLTSAHRSWILYNIVLYVLFCFFFTGCGDVTHRCTLHTAAKRPFCIGCFFM